MFPNRNFVTAGILSCRRFVSFILSSDFFFPVLGSELRAYTTPPAHFCDGFFQDRVLRTICLGWLQTAILLISAF
jgi:hypothetical protein